MSRTPMTYTEFYKHIGLAGGTRNKPVKRVFLKSCPECFQPMPITDKEHKECPKGGEK